MALPLGDEDRTMSSSLEDHKDSRVLQTSEETKARITDLNEKLIQQGEDVFFKELPVEVLLLTERIKNESLFSMSSQELAKELYGNIHEFTDRLVHCNDLKNEFVKSTRGSYDSWVKQQKKRRSQKRNSSVLDIKEPVRDESFTLPADCSIPPNSKLAELLRFVNDEMTKVSRMVVAIKLWISLNVPRIEDGNNFGVSVQEEYIANLNSMEGAISNVVSFISNYLLNRGVLLGNLIRFPDVEDLQYMLASYDEWYIMQFRMNLIDCRNSLALLYDHIGKNINWLYVPRMESDVQHMFI
ncbi:hypothetical protein WA171_002764 [Blastocystis sp. BT1]